MASESEFSTAAPVSLYGATKLASEVMALEYASAFDFPLWITRCGVLAGAGQFGTAGSGHFRLLDERPPAPPPASLYRLRGNGHQTRDAFHPRDLAALLVAQMSTSRSGGQRVYTAGGGPANIHVARATDRLVRRALRTPRPRHRSGAAALRHPLGRHGQTAVAARISAGPSKRRFPAILEEIAPTRTTIRSGWS